MKVFLDGVVPLEMTEEKYERLNEQLRKEKDFQNELVREMALEMDRKMMQELEG